MTKIIYTLALLLSTYLIGFAQYYGYDLNNIVISSDAINPIEGITSIEEDQFTEDISLDIVNWNVNWLGAPQMVDNKYGERTEHINNVAQKLVEINADVYALQEVVVDNINGNALEELLAEMNRILGDEIFAGIHSTYHSFYWQASDPDFPPQCLAYIWKKSVVSVNSTKALLEDYTSYANFGYGRLPFLLDANITLNGKTQRYMFINIHLKAMTGYSEMRESSMALLKELLYVNYNNNNVVLLGDYNVADLSGALGEVKDWGMYNDNDKDGICDFVHTAGNKNNGIEHTLISNDLYDELAYTPEYFRNKTLNGTGIILSDHYAYQARLYVYEETGNNNPTDYQLFSSSNYDFTMSTSDYQTIVDFVKNNPELAAQDPSTYNDSEYYFGSSSYYSNFDIREGKHNSTFNTWQDAVKSAISLALLPSKFLNAEKSDSVYHVSFNTFSGEDETYTFNFECTKSAPNPEFSFTTRTSNDHFEVFKLQAYPNPTSDQLWISAQKRIVSYSIFNPKGQKLKAVHSLNNTNFQINVEGLQKGLYHVKMITEENQHKSIRFLKE